MTRSELERYIAEQYAVEGDFPWARYPRHEVFRHGGSKKWFALLMPVPAGKLGLPPAEAPVEILNVKCDPRLLGSLLGEPGIYPAYHMNRENWLSLAIEQVDENQLQWLLELSFQLTAPKGKPRILPTERDHDGTALL